jgi:hypothetical protein
VPGTPLYAEHLSKGSLIPGIDDADIHGQLAFNFYHPYISREDSGNFLLRAFQRDYEVNGPSVMRIARTLLLGWQRYKNHPEQRIRERFRREAEVLALGYGSALWAMERYFRDLNGPLTEKIRQLRSDFAQEFGMKTRLASPVAGRVIYQMIRREERRLNKGWTYQPRMFMEKRNWERLVQTREARSLEVLPQT